MADGPLGHYIDSSVDYGHACLPPYASLDRENFLPKHDSDCSSPVSSQQRSSPGRAVPAAPALNDTSEGSRSEAGARSRRRQECLPRDESLIFHRSQRQDGAANQLASDDSVPQADSCSTARELREQPGLRLSPDGSSGAAVGEDEVDPTLLIPGAACPGAGVLYPGHCRRRDEPDGPDSMAQALPRRKYLNTFDDFLNESPKKKPGRRALRTEATEPVVTVLSDDSKSCEPSQGASPISLNFPVSRRPKPSRWPIPTPVSGKGGRNGKEQKARPSKLSDPAASPAVEVLGTRSGVGEGRNKGYNLRQAERIKTEDEAVLRKIYWELADGVVTKLQAGVFEYPRNREDSVELTAKDLQQLEPGGFLNDVIIQFYLKFLQEKRRLNGAEGVKCYFFNTFFYTKLTEYKNDASKSSTKPPAAAVAGDAGAPGMSTRSCTPPEQEDTQAGPAAPAALTNAQLRARAAFQRVRRWTKHVNIFEFDFVFIPINMEEHWSLMVACHFNKFADWIREGAAWTGEKPYLVHLDSLSQHKNVATPIRSYFGEAWLAQNEGKADRALVESAAKRVRCYSPLVPKQDNFSDCGVFVLKYSEMFLRDHAQPWSSATGTPSQDQPEWFDPLDVGSMRFLILFLVRWIMDKEAGIDAGPEPDEEHVKAVLARRLVEESEKRARATQQKEKRRPAAAAAPSGLDTILAGKRSAQQPAKRASRAPQPSAAAEKSLIEYALQAPSVLSTPGLDASRVAGPFEDEGSPARVTGATTRGEGLAQAGPGGGGAQCTTTGTTSLRDSSPVQSLSSERRSWEWDAETGASAAKSFPRASPLMWGKAAWQGPGSMRASREEGEREASGHPAGDHLQREAKGAAQQSHGDALSSQGATAGAPGDAAKQRFNQEDLDTAYMESLRLDSPFAGKGMAQEDMDTADDESLRPDNPFAGKGRAQEGLDSPHTDRRGSVMGSAAQQTVFGGLKVSLGEDVEVEQEPQGKPSAVEELREMRQTTERRRGGEARGDGTRAGEAGTSRTAERGGAYPLPPRPGMPEETSAAQARGTRPIRGGFHFPKVKRAPGAQGRGTLAAGYKGPGEIPLPSRDHLEQEHGERPASPQVPASPSRQARSEGLDGAQPEHQPSSIASAVQGSDTAHGATVRGEDSGAAGGRQEAPAMAGAAREEEQAQSRKERAHREQTASRPLPSKPKKHKGWQEGARERMAARGKAVSGGAASRLGAPVTDAGPGQRTLDSWGEPQGRPVQQQASEQELAGASRGKPEENPWSSHRIGGAAAEAVRPGRRDQASRDPQAEERLQSRGVDAVVGDKGPTEAAFRVESEEDAPGEHRQRDERDADGDVVEVEASRGLCAQASSTPPDLASWKAEGRPEGEGQRGRSGTGASPFKGAAKKARHLGEVKRSPGGKGLKGSPKRRQTVAGSQAEESGEDITEVLQAKGSMEEVREVEGPAPSEQKQSKARDRNGLETRDVSEPKRRRQGNPSWGPDQDVVALDRSFSSSSSGRPGFCELPLGQGSAKPWGQVRSPGSGKKEGAHAPGLRQSELGDSSPNGLLFGRPMALGAASPRAPAGHKSPRQGHSPQKKRQTEGEGSVRKSLPGRLPSAEPESSSEGEGAGAAFQDELRVLQGSGEKPSRRVAGTSMYEDAAREEGEGGPGYFMNGDRVAKRSGTPFRVKTSRQRRHERLQAEGARAAEFEPPTLHHTSDASPSQRQSTRIQENGQRRKERENHVRNTIHRRGHKKNRLSHFEDLPRPQASTSASRLHASIDLTGSDGEG